MPDTSGNNVSSMANSVHLDRLRMRPLDGEMSKVKRDLPTDDPKDFNEASFSFSTTTMRFLSRSTRRRREMMEMGRYESVRKQSSRVVIDRR